MIPDGQKFVTKLTLYGMSSFHFYRQHCVQRKPADILIYSEADFEVFRTAGAARCTNGGEIWQGGEDLRSPSPSPNFIPIGATTRV